VKDSAMGELHCQGLILCDGLGSATRLAEYNAVALNVFLHDAGGSPYTFYTSGELLAWLRIVLQRTGGIPVTVASLAEPILAVALFCEQEVTVNQAVVASLHWARTVEDKLAPWSA
jgi:hypothetical protein